MMFSLFRKEPPSEFGWRLGLFGVALVGGTIILDVFVFDGLASEVILRIVYLCGLIVFLWSIIRTAREFVTRQKKNHDDEVTRAAAQENRRKREESLQIYRENYQLEEKALKRRILDELKAVTQGEKVRFAPEAIRAAKALQARHGDHRETVAAWAPVIRDLSAESVDAKALHSRLNDLLYPEALEDVEELKRLVIDNMKRVIAGEKSDPTAAQALNQIRERHARKQHEEREFEAAERQKERETREEYAKAMTQMAKSSERNIARLYGLPENTFEGMPPHEVLMNMRLLRLNRKFEHLPIEEREERIFQELEKELDQERQTTRYE
jgi:hypothetical protein